RPANHPARVVVDGRETIPSAAAAIAAVRLRHGGANGTRFIPQRHNEAFSEESRPLERCLRVDGRTISGRKVTRMRSTLLLCSPRVLSVCAGVSLAACAGGPVESTADSSDAIRGGGPTDQRVPQLGDDLRILNQSKIKMGDAIAEVEARQGP